MYSIIVKMLILLSLSIAFDCSAKVNTTVPYLVEHYKTFIENTVRDRRDVEASNHPIRHMTLVNMTPTQHYVAGLAYKLTALYFPTTNGGGSLDVTITTSADSVATDIGMLVGSANEATMTITLYPHHIPNSDAMLAVLMHELFHLFGYGRLSDNDGNSFYNTTDPSTLLYNTTRTANCGPLYTDGARVHWSSLGHDLMNPLLYFDTFETNVCTILAILNSRPLWTTSVCIDDTDCKASGETCIAIGKHWAPVCGNATATHDAKQFNRNVFISLSVAMCGLFGLLLP